METIPIILDTDIGSDIDDAVALAYLLKQKRCELLGITTVSGEADKRASLADAICTAAGRRDVPIHVGAMNPLLREIVQDKAPQAEALGDQYPHREFGAKNTAIDFLRDSIHSRPGEITLLTIGPLTNIALLFALDPEIPGLLKNLMMMGGEFFGGSCVEWNIVCDPHAAQMVFNAPVPKLTAVGLDVTGKCSMRADECRSRFAKAGGALDVVGAMAEVWFRHAESSTFHDPVAAALIFDPTLCTTIPGKVSVELCDQAILCKTTVSHDGPQPHDLAKEVKADAFFEEYFGVVGG